MQFQNTYHVNISIHCCSVLPITAAPNEPALVRDKLRQRHSVHILDNNKPACQSAVKLSWWCSNLALAWPKERFTVAPNSLHSLIQAGCSPCLLLSMMMCITLINSQLCIFVFIPSVACCKTTQRVNHCPQKIISSHLLGPNSLKKRRYFTLKWQKFCLSPVCRTERRSITIKTLIRWTGLSCSACLISGLCKYSGLCVTSVRPNKSRHVYSQLVLTEDFLHTHRGYTVLFFIVCWVFFGVGV